MISIVYRWGGIETLTCLSFKPVLLHFYCLPLRRYWDGLTGVSLPPFTHFYCLPLRRYWDTLHFKILCRCGFLLSTAEAVLRHSPSSYFPFSSYLFLLSTAEAVLRLLGAWQRSCQFPHFYCLPLRRYWDDEQAVINLQVLQFLLSTAEAVLRPRCHSLPLPLYKRFLLSTAEAVLRHINAGKRRIRKVHFYCLPLRRYWDATLVLGVKKDIISIVYRWGGIETQERFDYMRCTQFLLSTAEAVLRRSAVSASSLYSRLFLLSTAEAVLRRRSCYRRNCVAEISIVYRWGGIETLPPFTPISK